jgi:hypothetical protein
MSQFAIKRHDNKNPATVPNELDVTEVKTDTLILDQGTAATPSLSFKNDSNTGIYSEGDNTVNISANGLKQVTVSPSVFRIETPFNMKAQSGNAMLNFLRQSDEAVSTTFRVRDTLNDAFFTGLSQRAVTDFECAIFSGGSNLILRSNSRFMFLHTSKNATNSGATNAIELYTTESGTFRRDVEIVSQTERGGRVLCRGQTGLVNAAFPTYSFENDSDTGILWTGSDAFSLVTNGVERVLIDNTRTTIANTLRYTGAPVTDGYVLQTDANGDALWSNIETIASLNTVTGNYSGAATTAHETLRYSKSNGVVIVEYDEEKKIDLTSSGTLNLTALPVNYRPARVQLTTYLYNDSLPSGNDTIARVQISTAGVVTFFADLSGASFAGSESLFIRRWSFSFLTA